MLKIMIFFSESYFLNHSANLFISGSSSIEVTLM